MNELTQEQKRVKIAEACGWKPRGSIGGTILMWPPMHGDAQEPPDYFFDLNAANAMEEHVKDWPAYIKMMAKVMAGDTRPRTSGNIVRADTSVLVNAKAEIRAESFGLTHNLWTP